MQTLKALLFFLLFWAALARAGAETAAPAGKLTMTFIALKTHGTATLVQAPCGNACLVDTGLADKEYDAGRDTIGPLLKARGITALFTLVLTHPHGDHYGGAPWLMEHFAIRNFIDHGYEGRGQTDVYRALRAQARERGAKYAVVHAGDRLEWDPALSVEVLSPPREFLNQDSDPAKVSEHSVLNQNSIVLRIQHGENVFLLPGDVYGAEWMYMVKQWPAEKLRANVLGAPHHGYNSTPGFAALIRPQVVVASCRASYGNGTEPSPDELARKVYEPVGAKVYSTPRHGNVTVVSDGKAIQVTTERNPESKSK